MTRAEAAYLKVVAEKNHQLRIGSITAAQRDSAVNAAWQTYQTTAKQKRDQFRTSQAGAASTYRNTVANAEKTYVDLVTGANETLTNSLADAQKNLAEDRWNAWLKGSKALVGLDAQSATQTAKSLANARSGLRQKSPIACCFAMSRSGGSLATSTTFSFLGPSSGILDDRRDFEVGTAEARAVLRKGAQAAAGRRDREIADANLTLAQARSSYEVGWAQMGAEDSQWKLERSDLPIQGSDNGTITTTTTAGTQFVPGAFRMTPPAAGQQANSPKTSTGFGGNDLDQYFSNGFLKNGVDDQPQLGQLAGPAGEPIAQDPPNRNLVQESETLPPDDSKVTYDPAETQSAFGALVGWVASWFDGEEETAVSGATLPAKPKSPQELLDERDALQAEIASLEASLGRALTWYEQELKKEQAKGLTTHQIEQSITMRQHREATRKSWDRLQEMKKKLQVVVVVLQTEHPQILNAEEQRKLQEAAYARLKDKKFSPQEFDALFEGASVFRDDGQLILKEGDIWTVFTFHPAQYANTMVFPPSGPFVSADYVKLVEPAYWQLQGRFPATLSFRSIQEMKGILEELGSKQQLQIVAEFALHVVPFGTLTDKIATGEGGDWDEVLLTTAGDALFVVSFGFGGTTAAARLAQARIAAGSVGVNLFGAGYETFKALTDEEGLTTARGANIFAGLLFAMLDAKELARLQKTRLPDISGNPIDGAAGSYDKGFINQFVDGTLSEKQLTQVKEMLEHLRDRNGKGVVVLLGQEADGYVQFLHDIILRAPSATELRRGTLAEEIQHAIDAVSGLFTDRRVRNGVPRLKQQYGEFYNAVWHMHTFERIAQTLQSGKRSIFLIFMSVADADSFFKAAAEIRRRLRELGIDV